MNPTATPLPDIRDIVPPHPYFLPVQYLWLALGAVLLFAAGWAAARYLRRARKIPPLTPRQLAAMRLAELQRHIEALDARTFGGEVCDVLRIYIGGEFKLHPERQTSAEFLNSISGASAFTPREHGLLADFLEHCDLLKFARHDATLPAKQQLLEQATNFLEHAGAAADPAATPAPPAGPAAPGFTPPTPPTLPPVTHAMPPTLPPAPDPAPALAR